MPTPSSSWPGWRERWPAWSAGSRPRPSWPSPPAPATAPASAGSPHCWPCCRPAPPGSPWSASTTASAPPAPGEPYCLAWSPRGGWMTGAPTIAWFHCFSGIAGDMALGSLIDAGADLDEVRTLLARLPVDGWRLEAEPVLRGGIAATKAHVHVVESAVVRTAVHITGLVEEARLPDRVARRALGTFRALAEVEGRLHRRPPEQVHFHEVGGLDAIVVGWGPLPAMRIAATGFGAGSREMDGRPNVVQVVVGQAETRAGTGAEHGRAPGQPVVLLETNVDDAGGEVLAHAIGALLEAGAHDAWVTPIVMKKGRPAHTVSALVDPALAEQVAAALMAETGTLGLRGTTLDRWPAARAVDTVDVDGMPVRVKVSPGRVKVEHDDAARVARTQGRPLREVLSVAESEARRLQGRRPVEGTDEPA